VKGTARLVLAALLVVGGGVAGAQAPAWGARHAGCDPVATGPTFTGNTIHGVYGVECLTRMPAWKVIGRIKEDRPAFPDAVHKTKSFHFVDDMTHSITKTTCQDDDAIYIESEIPGLEGVESDEVYQTSTRLMHC
jgi:hypothetical protein